VTNAFSTGAVTAGGTAGGLVGDDSGGTVTASFWDVDTSAQSTSDGGTGLTTPAMKSTSSFANAGWSITAGWQPFTAGTAVWGQCASVNSGYPFLLWEYSSNPCGTTPPTPSTPAGPPRAVEAAAGDSSANLTWSAPASSGSFPITQYQAVASPGGAGCLVAAATLTCEVGGLANGTTYTFTVRALNGAGWGPYSAPSNAVTPQAPVVPSIVISGTRGEVRGKPGIVITGSASNLGTAVPLRPWVRFPGQTGFVEGSARIVVDQSGEFTWQRRTGKKAYVYVRAGDVPSNRVIIPAR
jgi:hypothetical protein